MAASCQTVLHPNELSGKSLQRADQTSNSLPETGSIFDRYPNIDQAMRGVLFDLRNSIQDLRADHVAGRSAEEVFDAGLVIRQRALGRLRAQARLCSHCEIFAAELERTVFALEKRSEAMVTGRELELGHLSKISLERDISPVNLMVGDLIGQIGELYGFGLFRDARRGVVLRKFIENTLGVAGRDISKIFRENSLDQKLLEKEFDLMARDDSVWVEIKAFDPSGPRGSVWEKVLRQLKDNVLVLSNLRRGLRLADGSDISKSISKMRYLFFGTLPDDYRIELETTARAACQEFNIAPHQCVPVEFAAIPLH